jgi:hypothetical protein
VLQNPNLLERVSESAADAKAVSDSVGTIIATNPAYSVQPDNHSRPPKDVESSRILAPAHACDPEGRPGILCATTKGRAIVFMFLRRFRCPLIACSRPAPATLPQCGLIAIIESAQEPLTLALCS